MENIKFYAVTLLLVLAAGFLGYGAISSLRDPVYYVNNQTLATVGDVKAGTTSETPTTETPVATTPEIPTQNPDTTATPTTTPETPTTETPAVTTPTTSLATNADIKAALQKIASSTVLKKGSTGDDVKALQAALNAVAKSGLPINGTFGAQTETAVKKFQTSAKLPSTGQVASKTIMALVGKL
jgi:murein L,D-transpeptidase YcbB/YkuD